MKCRSVCYGVVLDPADVARQTAVVCWLVVVLTLWFGWFQVDAPQFFRGRDERLLSDGEQSDRARCFRVNEWAGAIKRTYCLLSVFRKKEKLGRRA